MYTSHPTFQGMRERRAVGVECALRRSKLHRHRASRTPNLRMTEETSRLGQEFVQCLIGHWHRS